MPSFAEASSPSNHDAHYATLRTLDVLIDKNPEAGRSHCFRLRQSFEVPIFRTIEAFYESLKLDPKECPLSVCLPIVASRALVTIDRQNLFWGNHNPTAGGSLNLFWHVPVCESEENEITIHANSSNRSIDFFFKGDQSNFSLECNKLSPEKNNLPSNKPCTIRTMNSPRKPITKEGATFLEQQLEPLMLWAESILDKASPEIPK